MAGASDMKQWMRKGRDLFLMTGDVKYIDAMERRGGNVWKELPCVAELAVTRDINHTLFVNLYSRAAVEMDGVSFEISGSGSMRDHVKVTTRSPIPRNVRLRLLGAGGSPSRYVSKRIKPGAETFEIRFDKLIDRKQCKQGDR